MAGMFAQVMADFELLNLLDPSYLLVGDSDVDGHLDPWEGLITSH